MKIFVSAFGLCGKGISTELMHQAGKKTTLDNKRTKQLQELGFNWEQRGYSSGRGHGRRDDDGYKENVDKLRKVKELYGDFNNWTKIEKVVPGEGAEKFRNWIMRQRKHCKA